MSSSWDRLADMSDDERAEAGVAPKKPEPGICKSILEAISIDYKQNIPIQTAVQGILNE